MELTLKTSLKIQIVRRSVGEIESTGSLSKLRTIWIISSVVQA
jgi:hypothetical protein